MENITTKRTYNLKSKNSDLLLYSSIVLFLIAIIALILLYASNSYYYYYYPLTLYFPYIIIGFIILIVAQIKPRNDRKYLNDLIRIKRKLDMNGNLLHSVKDSIIKEGGKQPNFCGDCGQEINSNMKYCSYCGNKI
ncbi:MAG: zinc ribbon domain-containing protein [Candidatus Lokiarchaeota archaeon]|nr:zinc ribbon domain-containing protein [Candidatus Lokiarchaeota archaeon]